MQRRFVNAALVLAVVLGPVGVSLSVGATVAPKRTRRESSVAPRVKTFNRLSPGLHTINLMVGDLQRTFILSVPPGKPVANRGLVLAYHGATSSAEATIQETNILQQVKAGRDVAAFMQGYVDGTWNEGSGSTPASLAHVNDVAYSAAVIARVRKLESFDPSRVAAVGFSNGAIMVEDLGCHLASLISLIIPVEGQLSTVQSASCSPARPESVYEIHGTADGTIPYDGGYFSTSVGYDTMLGAPQSVARWGHLDGCSAGPVSATPNSVITLSMYTHCRDGAFVTLRTIAGGGHAWPADIGQLVVQEVARLPK